MAQNNYCYPAHMPVFYPPMTAPEQQQQQCSKFKLIRSPRFVKQLSDIRAAGRQQLLNDPRKLSPAGSSQQSADSSPLLLMMTGAFPSPRSTSTTASTDNLQLSSSSVAQQPSFISTQKIQLVPRTLLIVPQTSNPRHKASEPQSNYYPPYSENRLISYQNDSYEYASQVVQPNNSSQLAAISCLASPPWTRSSSPNSSHSNANSVSPPIGFQFGALPQKQPFQPPLASVSPPRPLTAKSPVPPAITLSRHDEDRDFNANGTVFRRDSPTEIALKELPPRYTPPPPPPPLPPLKSTQQQKEPPAVTPHLAPTFLTPCKLISTSTRPATIRPRSASMSSVRGGVFCASENANEEPFELVPLPDVDAERFPEQSWAYRNVRKLVSRLSAHVKSRRRSSEFSAASKMSPLRNAMSIDSLNERPAKHNTAIEDDAESTCSDYETASLKRAREVREELARISRLVREQFGGSLTSVLCSSARSNRSVSLPPNARVGPLATATPATRRESSEGTRRLTSGRPVPPPVRASLPHVTYQAPDVKPIKPTIPPQQQPSSRLVVSTCQNRAIRCLSCPYCTSQQILTQDGASPLSRYGLRGQHIHIPPDELDLNARPDDAIYDFYADENFDETDIPRSALSPEFGYPDPYADDMFRRNMVRAVRF